MCARKMRSKLGFPVVVGSLTLNLLCATQYAHRMKEIELYGERRDDCSVIRHGDIDRLSEATCCDHVNLAADEIGRQCGQPIRAALCPAIFDRHILSLDIARFAQSPA